jgi:hypothetical protein
MMPVLESRPDSAYRFPTGPWSRFGAAVDVIRINSLAVRSHAARRYWVKERNLGSRWVINGANAFFRVVRNPVFVLANVAAWQNWEVRCFSLLNGDRFTAFPLGSAVWMDDIPGEDLALLAKQSRLQPVHLAAAGAEFRRMHDLWSPEFKAKWSHGDPHLGNVILDAGTGRARIIDFETTHFRYLPPEQRHADDLKVFLLDLLGRSIDGEWPENASAFLNAYGCTGVLDRLRRIFVMPSGAERLWWAIRTSYLPGVLLRRRVTELQSVIP